LKPNLWAGIEDIFRIVWEGMAHLFNGDRHYKVNNWICFWGNKKS